MSEKEKCRSTHVVQELSASIAVDVMRIEITPAELYVNPVLVAGGAVKHVLALNEHSHEWKPG